jgi:hypothetical protein
MISRFLNVQLTMAFILFQYQFSILLSGSQKPDYCIFTISLVVTVGGQSSVFVLFGYWLMGVVPLDKHCRLSISTTKFFWIFIRIKFIYRSNEED